MENKILKKIPEHLAIIMDGNGRWASNRKLSRTEGHREGVKAVSKITKHCGEIGIKYLTLYTFSEENWKRPKSEIIALMKLLIESLEIETKALLKNNVQFKVIGDLNKLDLITRNKLKGVEKITKDNTGLNLILAVSYGSRQEMINAINELIKNKISNITESIFSDLLYTKDIPDPDLLIRSGKHHRISNFLLWQIAYTEIYFSDILWPDFNEESINQAIVDFNLRKRTYGKIN